MASLTRTATFEETSAEFRQHLPDLSIPRFTVSKEQTPYEYVNDFQTNHVPPWLYNLTETWKELLKEPFKGVTSDGMIQDPSVLDTLVLSTANRKCSK